MLEIASLINFRFCAAGLSDFESSSSRLAIRFISWEMLGLFSPQVQPNSRAIFSSSALSSSEAESVMLSDFLLNVHPRYLGEWVMLIFPFQCNHSCIS